MWIWSHTPLNNRSVFWEIRRRANVMECTYANLDGTACGCHWMRCTLTALVAQWVCLHQHHPKQELLWYNPWQLAFLSGMLKLWLSGPGLHFKEASLQGRLSGKNTLQPQDQEEPGHPAPPSPTPNWGTFVSEILVDLDNWPFELLVSFSSWALNSQPYVLNCPVKSEPGH